MYKILIAVDGSDHAERTVDKAVELARQLKSVSIHVLNVQEPPILYGEIQAYMTVDKAEQFTRAAGERIVAAAAERLRNKGFACTSEAAIGDIAPTIADRGRAVGCNLIVLGTRGMGAVGNLVLGSVATKVVHLTTIAVMLVH